VGCSAETIAPIGFCIDGLLGAKCAELVSFMLGKDYSPLIYKLNFRVKIENKEKQEKNKSAQNIAWLSA
jgi:hypothetical protein